MYDLLVKAGENPDSGLNSPADFFVFSFLASAQDFRPHLSDTILSPDDHPAPMNPDKIDEILAFHTAQKDAIDARLADFRRIWALGSDRDLFAELAFCILTPQSRARTCWPAIERLRSCDLLYAGSAAELQEIR